jgi:hypothetical protein
MTSKITCDGCGQSVNSGLAASEAGFRPIRLVLIDTGKEIAGLAPEVQLQADLCGQCLDKLRNALSKGRINIFFGEA